MKKVFTIFAITFLMMHNYSYAQDTVRYCISFTNAIRHEAEITVSADNFPPGELTLIMSNSSPGRYSIHNFAKNIYNVKAVRQGGSKQNIIRTKPNEWKISDTADLTSVSYTLYGNYANGTYSGIDRDFVILNMPASLLRIKDLDLLPVKVKLDIPDSLGWTAATQLQLIDSSKNIYTAPHFQYLMDSPILLGNLKEKEFLYEEDSTLSFRMAFNCEDSEVELNNLVNMTKKVVKEQQSIFGSFPNFYNNTYTFLCSVGPGNYDDGMEHRNSAVLTNPASFSSNRQFMDGISHEFFHVWNIERIRPASLEPFDFTNSNMSGELWFGEGFTNYYGDLTLCRSGVTDQAGYLNSLSAKLNYFINAPGRNYGSPVYMSEMATFGDRASSVEENNFANVFFTYYNYGEMIALALDLSLRTNYKGKSLDDFMKAVWINYGVEEIPYTNSDLQKTLAEVSGNKVYAESFFEKYIYGNELPDYTSLLDKFGYKLIKKNPGKPSLGFARFTYIGDTATLISDPLVGSALYEAGVNKGDLILSIDEQPVTSYPELNFIIGTRKIDDEVNISYSHRGIFRKGTLKLKEDDQLLLIPKESFSIKISEEEEKNRTEWLISKADKPSKTPK